MRISPRRTLRQDNRAYTLVEVLVGAAMMGVVLSALVLGSTMLQEQFTGSTRYADAQSDQIRAMDYIEMDLRRAISATTASGATPLTLTLPDYYQTVNGKKVPRLPTKAGFRVTYGTSTITVTYSLQGTNLIRTEAGVARTIATSVVSFPTPVRTTSPNRMNVTLTFDYKMKREGNPDVVTLNSQSFLRNLR